MKRRKASAKMTNVVHSGWMTKSPPERKLHTAFKIFRSQWKKRFFVLRKPSGSLPDQYELHYYKDQRCNTKKGSIDLEQCEQIIEALDSDVFPYLLAIKTYYKNKVRTYYLAADSEQEMNTWVQWLCHVCGLKPEDQHIPEPKPGQATGVSRQPSIPGAGPVVANGRPPSPPQPGSPALSASPQATGGGFEAATTQPVPRTTSDSSLCYIPLENCTTGQPQAVERWKSVESVPDFDAPAPPPQKRHGSQSNGAQNLDDDVFVPGLYDHPPPQRSLEASGSRGSSDLYKVPPARPSQSKMLSVDKDERDSLSYDVPPPRVPSPHLILNNQAETKAAVVEANGQAAAPLESYDYPPPRREQIPSSDTDTPPARPPKPGHRQSPYQNLPPAGALGPDTNLNTVLAPPKHHTIRQTLGYDVPRSSSHHVSRPQPGTTHMNTVPPRPNRHNLNSLSGHTYLNTHNKPGSSELYLAPRSGSDGEQSTDPTDTGAAPPLVPPSRTDSSGDSQSSRSASPSLYQFPPSSSAPSSAPGAPIRPPARTVVQGPSVSPRNVEGSCASNQAQDENQSVIFSTQRTRSFKRGHNVNSESPKPSPKLNTTSGQAPVSKLNTTSSQAPVPATRPVIPSRPKEISTSDEDEETHHPLSLLRAVPPVSAENDRELKYIDLDLPESSLEPPRSSHAHGHGHSHSHSHNHMDRGKDTATEYREIDFVKTQALNDTKRVKEKERKNDDHN